WLPLWILAVTGLSVARDATFVVVAGLLWAAARHRSRRAAWLAGSGLLAALPAPLLFGAPVRVALAYTLNGFQAQADPSWGAIAHGYLRGAHSLVKNDLDYLARDPYVAVLGLGGFVLLFALRDRSDPVVSLMRASALAALGYLLLLPNYTGFRLELVLVPMIAVGIA